MNFSTLRSILSSTPPMQESPAAKSPNFLDNCKNETGPDALDLKICASSEEISTMPKSGNKRKAAFEAWHQKKLAQMKTDNHRSATDSHLRQFLSSTPSALSICKTDQCDDQSLLSIGVATDHTSSSAIRKIDSDHKIDRSKLSPPAREIDQSISSAKIDQNGLLSKLLKIDPIRQPYPTDRNIDRSVSNAPAQLTTAAARNLTAPKLSRHNDAAFYPNIQCILCHEWVCSRNRYMHIESHFQYRPYKCSVCGYDNRKQIFIELHISRVHKGAAQILYHPDSELEKRAWTMAEQCLQHTREVLLRRKLDQKASESSTDREKSIIVSNIISSTSANNVNGKQTPPILTPYSAVYRPKIYNNQRSEKSNLIEESRLLGLIPDFSEVTAREQKCRICDAHVLKTPTLLEEHARTHLTRPSYGCSMTECHVTHHSRNFVIRHMKEVHRVRRGVIDLLEQDRNLLDEYLTTCGKCFPEFFATSTNGESKKINEISQSMQQKSIKEYSGSNNGAISIIDSKVDSIDSNRIKIQTTINGSPNLETAVSSINNNRNKSISVQSDSITSSNGDSAKVSTSNFVKSVKNDHSVTHGDRFNSSIIVQSGPIAPNHPKPIDTSIDHKTGNEDSMKTALSNFILPSKHSDRIKTISLDFLKSIGSYHFKSIDVGCSSRLPLDNSDQQKSIAKNNQAGIDLPKSPDHCLGCINKLNLFSDHSMDNRCVSCRSSDQSISDCESIRVLICDLCDDIVMANNRSDVLHQAESHSLKHCYTLPFQCVYCPYSHWRKIDLDTHFQQVHPNLEPGATKLFFRWPATIDWPQMWRNSFDRCYSQQVAANQSIIDRSIKSISCYECGEIIPNTRADKFDHCVSRHCSGAIREPIRFDCVYCSDQGKSINCGKVDRRLLADGKRDNRNFDGTVDHRDHIQSLSPNGSTDQSIIGQSITDHIASVHPGMPAIKCSVITFRSRVDIDQAKDYFRASMFHCYEKPRSTSAISIDGDRQQIFAQNVFCRLCHVEILDDPTSHILHLQYHLQAPVYKCRACSYMDVDVDRMKEHVDSRHQGKVPYVAETLPLDQESKALRLIEWCFQLPA